MHSLAFAYFFDGPNHSVTSSIVLAASRISFRFAVSMKNFTVAPP